MLLITILAVLCLTGCGVNKGEEYCRNKGAEIAKEYLKEKYNIDAEITYSEPKMKDQFCLDSSCTGGYPAGPVYVVAKHNGKTISLNVNCYTKSVTIDEIN